MKKPEITQSELSDYYAKGEFFVIAYNTVFEIRWSKGVKRWIMVKIYYNKSSLSLTKKGRFFVFNEENLNKLIY